MLHSRSKLVCCNGFGKAPSTLRSMLGQLAFSPAPGQCFGCWDAVPDNMSHTENGPAVLVHHYSIVVHTVVHKYIAITLVHAACRGNNPDRPGHAYEPKVSQWLWVMLGERGRVVAGARRCQHA